MAEQINPPFDGSKPCPMCQCYVRGLAALLHNAYCRWGQGKFFVKVNDLIRSYEPETPLTVPHPATEAMLELVKDIVAACADGGLTEDGVTIRWTPECAAKLGAMYDRWCKVCFDLDPLSEAHFEDYRHSHGGENLLREQRGGKFIGYGEYKLPGPRTYAHTVERVSAGGDIRHGVCNTEFKLHDHFKDRLSKDKSFYAKVWCPTCMINAPFAQFQMLEEKS